MTDVKRYECTNGRAQHCYGCYQMTNSAVGDYVESADFDRVTAEGDALQQRLNAADQRIDELESLLHEWRKGAGPRLRDIVDLHKRTDAAIKPAAEACEFPQSCTTRCGCKTESTPDTSYDYFNCLKGE